MNHKPLLKHNYRADSFRSKLTKSTYVIIILCIAVMIFVGIYFDSSNKILSSILLNVSSGVISAIFIMFVLNYFLSNPDRMIIEKVESLINSQVGLINFDLNERDSLEFIFSQVRQSKLIDVCMMGYSMAHLLQQQEDDLVRMLCDGVEVKILLLDPHSVAGDVLELELGDKAKKIVEPHERAMRYINLINDKVAAICLENRSVSRRIEVRTMPWIPSCNLILFKSKGEIFHIQVGLNGFVLDNNVDRRLYATYNNVHKDKNISFFYENFYARWRKSNIVQ